VLDVGANHGIYSLAALACQPGATVHAFEPTPEIATHLRATVKLNKLDRLHVHDVAVARQTGRAILKRVRGELGENEGMNFISENKDEPTAESVDTVSLDQFCQDQSIEHVDLLKLDIQGNENAALEGARNMIESGRIGIIFMELNWGASAGGTCSATDCIRILDRAGYRFSRPGKSFEWKNAGDWLETLSDVVAHRATSKAVNLP
jgi:FkbM family methyltransferase